MACLKSKSRISLNSGDEGVVPDESSGCDYDGYCGDDFGGVKSCDA